MSKATLGWSEVAGFTLDLDGSKGDVTVRFMGVTVPADGTDALRSEAIALFDMDMLFNTHIDVGDAPGQLHDARVRLDGEVLVLSGELEDAETGQQERWSIRLPVTIADDAPAAGGPVPEEPVEDDLDWDDEVPAPAGNSNASAGPSDSGLDALLRSLMSAETSPSASSDIEEPSDEALAALEVEDHSDDIDEDEDEDDDDDGGLDASLLAALLGGGGAQEESSPGHDVDHASNFLQLLVDREGLALEEGYTVHDLARGAVPILESNRSPAAMAKALSDYLLDQESVEELYIDDESLEQLLEQW